MTALTGVSPSCSANPVASDAGPRTGGGHDEGESTEQAFGHDTAGPNERLAVLVLRFTRLSGTALSSLDILDHLVEQVPATLPVQGAGSSLISNDLQVAYLAASDARAHRWEATQNGARGESSSRALHAELPVAVFLSR